MLEEPSCSGGFVPTRSFLGPGWRRRALRIGPLRLLNGATFATATLDDRRAYALRTLLPPGRALDIAIEANDPVVGFLRPGTSTWSGLPSDLYRVFRVDDCPPIPPEIRDRPAGRLYGYLVFVGVRRAACVPIAVRREGRRTDRRTVSFGSGDCA